ncbi:MAG: alpha/beta hydrolase [Propionibacteriaceae bacterium]|nr:alpha/beta hydrolase [Propionibacteriaceae bacterium]
MSRGSGRIAKGLGLVTGIGALAAGAIATGFELERRVVSQVFKKDRAALPEREPFFTLRAPGPPVVTRDGVELHVEVDEPTPGTEPGVTIVMVHGFVLSLHCWHFIRKHFRGRHKIVLYDQRSHGRSGRSAGKRCRIRQLARDLKLILDTTTEPDEPVVLMGHSMGGMAIMEFAARYPKLIGSKVVGVGLLATSGGDMRNHSIVKGIPGELFPRLVEPLMAALNRIPTVVEKSRKASSDIAYVVTRRGGFGSQVPGEYVDFLSEMISLTPLDVVADFYPAFAEFDGGRGLEVLARIETAVIGGVTDQIIPIEHTHRIVLALPGAESLEMPDSGHMGMIEHHVEYNEVLERLVARAERNLERVG